MSAPLAISVLQRSRLGGDGQILRGVLSGEAQMAPVPMTHEWQCVVSELGHVLMCDGCFRKSR
jgi:hypothetical protein